MNFTLSTELARADLVSSIQASCVEICWPGLANQLYQVQYSSALTAQWVNFGLPIHGNGTNCVTDSVRIAEHRFYRVIDAP